LAPRQLEFGVLHSPGNNLNRMHLLTVIDCEYIYVVNVSLTSFKVADIFIGGKRSTVVI